MLIKTIDISNIIFTYTTYPSYLKDSLLRIGLNFPIILESENNLTCVDGHKRLSAISDILKEHHDHKLSKVQVRFLYGRTSNPKSLQNHH